MIGICIEASVSCRSCKNPIPLNALVPAIMCPSCGNEATFTKKDWSAVLGDAIKEGAGTEEGEGSHSTCFAGNYTFSLMYGRQAPHFRDTTTPINMERAMESLVLGKIRNDETGSEWSIREVPHEYRDLCEGVACLLCESLSLLSSGGSYGLSQRATEPQAFTCPQCGGSLMVDGTTRTVLCTYCSNSSFLSDEIWQRLHPVEEVSRWYLWYDEKRRKVEWGSVHAVTVDEKGDIFMAAELGYKDVVMCMDGNLMPRWVQRDLPYDSDDMVLAVTPDALAVANKQNGSLHILSRSDGQVIRKLGGKDGKPFGEAGFSMKGTERIYCDDDGSLLISRYHTIKNKGTNTEFIRMDAQGNRLPLWRDADGKELRGKVPTSIPHLEKLGERPQFCSTSGVHFFRGEDGSYYFADAYIIAKYSTDGVSIYNAKMPYRLGYAALVSADREGYVYLFCENYSSHFVVRIDPDGSNLETYIANYRMGGPLGDEYHFVRSPAGRFYFFRYGQQMRVCDASGREVAATPQSRKELSEAMEKWQERGSD